MQPHVIPYFGACHENCLGDWLVALGIAWAPRRKAHRSICGEHFAPLFAMAEKLPHLLSARDERENEGGAKTVGERHGAVG